MMELLLLLLLLSLSRPSLSSLPATPTKRVRQSIPEVEEAELDNVVRTEAFVAVLYHDESKVQEIWSIASKVIV